MMNLAPFKNKSIYYSSIKKLADGKIKRGEKILVDIIHFSNDNEKVVVFDSENNKIMNVYLKELIIEDFEFDEEFYKSQMEMIDRL